MNIITFFYTFARNIFQNGDQNYRLFRGFLRACISELLHRLSGELVQTRGHNMYKMFICNGSHQFS